jgi:hypothetical protein
MRPRATGPPQTGSLRSFFKTLKSIVVFRPNQFRRGSLGMRRRGFRDRIWLGAAVSEVRSETANPSEIATFSGALGAGFGVCYGLTGGGRGTGNEHSLAELRTTSRCFGFYLYLPCARSLSPFCPYIASSVSGARSFFSSGISVIVASVNSNTLATETAFSSAMRTTLVGSMIPASMRSRYSLRAASKP